MSMSCQLRDTIWCKCFKNCIWTVFDRWLYNYVYQLQRWRCFTKLVLSLQINNKLFKHIILHNSVGKNRCPIKYWKLQFPHVAKTTSFKFQLKFPSCMVLADISTSDYSTSIVVATIRIVGRFTNHVVLSTTTWKLLKHIIRLGVNNRCLSFWKQQNTFSMKA